MRYEIWTYLRAANGDMGPMDIHKGDTLADAIRAAGIRCETCKHSEPCTPHSQHWYWLCGHGPRYSPELLHEPLLLYLVAESSMEDSHGR